VSSFEMHYKEIREFTLPGQHPEKIIFLNSVVYSPSLWFLVARTLVGEKKIRRATCGTKPARRVVNDYCMANRMGRL